MSEFYRTLGAYSAPTNQSKALVLSAEAQAVDAAYIRATMSTPVVPGDDPRDPSAEVKLSLPETWQVESLGK